MKKARLRMLQRRLQFKHWAACRLSKWQGFWDEWRLPPVVTNRWVMFGVYLSVVLMVSYAWFFQPFLWSNRISQAQPNEGYFGPYEGDIAPRGSGEDYGFPWERVPGTTRQPASPKEDPDKTVSQADPLPLVEAGSGIVPVQGGVPSRSQIVSAEEPVKMVAKAQVSLNSLEFPVDGPVINGYSLSHKSTTFNDWRPHKGLDFRAEYGTPVGAAARGTVKEIITDDILWGTVIVIDHGSGWATRYSNIAEPAVSVGQSVAAKQIIGKLGPNPLAEQLDEPHLHFELLQNGQAVDPHNRFR